MHRISTSPATTSTTTHQLPSPWYASPYPAVRTFPHPRLARLLSLRSSFCTPETNPPLLNRLNRSLRHFRSAPLSPTRPQSHHRLTPDRPTLFISSFPTSPSSTYFRNTPLSSLDLRLALPWITYRHVRHASILSSGSQILWRSVLVCPTSQ